MDPLIKDLLQILPKTRVKAKLIDVISFASDEGFYHLIPKVVVQTGNVEEVQQLFAIGCRIKLLENKFISWFTNFMILQRRSRKL